MLTLTASWLAPGSRHHHSRALEPARDSPTLFEFAGQHLVSKTVERPIPGFALRT